MLVQGWRGAKHVAGGKTLWHNLILLNALSPGRLQNYVPRD